MEKDFNPSTKRLRKLQKDEKFEPDREFIKKAMDEYFANGGTIDYLSTENMLNNDSDVEDFIGEYTGDYRENTLPSKTVRKAMMAQFSGRL